MEGLTLERTAPPPFPASMALPPASALCPLLLAPSSPCILQGFGFKSYHLAPPPPIYTHTHYPQSIV